MRLLTVINASDLNRLNPYAFSYILSSEGIENESEEYTIPGSSEIHYRIWIKDEDRVEEAENLWKEYQKNPTNPQLQTDFENAKRAEHLETLKEKKNLSSPLRRKGFLSPAPYGKASVAIIIIVIILFFWTQGTTKRQPPLLPGIPQAPFLSPVALALLYDVPKFLELRDELLKIYPPSSIEQKDPMGPEAESLLRQIQQTRYWNGIYDRVVNHLINPSMPVTYQGPIFEKISQGEIWRLITPILLHYDLLHIFFNLLWFVLLANQIESKIKFWRYILLILIIGIVSNTAQYLMSGPYFMGLSGVIVGFAGFIFARQQTAPWEGYLLHRLTLLFLAVFVFGVFALQVLFFFLQIFGKLNQQIPIANTAHIVGGVMGYLLGRFRFFALQLLHKSKV